MDPFYFLDLDIKHIDSSNDCELGEYLTCWPDGNWCISCDECFIIYDSNEHKENEYKEIFYNNKIKTIYFTPKTGNIFKKKLTLTDLN